MSTWFLGGVLTITLALSRQAYKDIEGRWAMGPQQLPGASYTLFVDWVQARRPCGLHAQSGCLELPAAPTAALPLCWYWC